jgi:alkylated DNA repair dioxygenase AlkB
MQTLFDVSPAYPQGFSYHKDFITEEEEQFLLAAVKEVDLHPMQFHGYTALRKVRSYGYDYHFNTQAISKGDPIPPAFIGLAEKVATHMQVTVAALAEMLITEYPPGSVINWHRDAPPFHQIAGISLLSEVIFKLRPHDKAKQNRKAIASFEVAPRSMYIIAGESRTGWQHSTAPVRDTRFSITFRTLQPGAYPDP